MITITRRQARRLRGVFRRHAIGIAHRGSIPPLVLRADGTQLRAQYRYESLAIETIDSVTSASNETLVLPLDALADFEGRDDTPVVLEVAPPDRTLVRWTDHGVPQSREYSVSLIDMLKPSPELPTEWTTLPAGILASLAQASETASEDTTRYALNCIQLKGSTGELAATDGHQLLIRGGFSFPWAENLLVRRSPLFACPALSHGQPAEIGRTESHVIVRSGPWTLFLEIQTGVRFPTLSHVVPDPTATASCLSLDPGDVRFLGEALARLPGSDELNAPATLDLNGKVAIRARGADQARATELVLARSGYTGAPVQLNTNRGLLGRALNLGFSAIEIVDADSPLVCRDRDVIFCWQPLSKESAIGPSDDVVRVEATPAVVPTPMNKVNINQESRTTVSQPRETIKDHEKSPETICGAAATESQEPAGLAALIMEAESLHHALTDARTRAGRLVVALRRHRRRERLVNTTLASLRALKLQDVAG